MLLAVEGGGFFSSSASGYSKGLTLLLLGRTSDEKHMRIAPWNKYELVDQDTDSYIQLASGKNRPSSGCASLVCFGRASAGLDGQSPLKVGPAQPQDMLPDGPEIEREKELSTTVHHDNNSRSISLKSSLKKPSHNTPQTVEKNNEQEPLTGEGKYLPELTERRKVQWMDTYGKELAEIREFELSETGGSDDEFINGNGKTCSCRIMFVIEKIIYTPEL
ncbi:hypothetical protein Cgig2_017572 [Carnegiea gigantea]|uniref:Uncharacterized protein n=1 Tax=Carnegiea gigantea TaxID=171969 RepID=A0A9Q1QN09_9CARY|nr:hypothetical protein Cgig2_017572 [Carnegiea gigantea]